MELKRVLPGTKMVLPGTKKGYSKGSPMRTGSVYRAGLTAADQ